MAPTYHGGSAPDISNSDEGKEKACSEHAESHAEKQLAGGSDFDMLPEEERRMVRKCDWRILPIVSALYVMSFLNRVNIGKVLEAVFILFKLEANTVWFLGNARLFNLEKDLGLSGNDYQICVSVLFATYVTFEIPSNILVCPLSIGVLKGYSMLIHYFQPTVEEAQAPAFHPGHCNCMGCLFTVHGIRSE